MATIFLDSFDHYQSLFSKWTNILNSNLQTYAIGAAYARPPGGQGISLVNNGGGQNQILRKAFGTNYISGCFGSAVYVPSSVALAGTLLTILDGTSEQISVRVNGSGILTVTRGGTVLGTGTTVLSAATWYYTELKFTIDPTAGVIELHLNGATEIASTGSLNTRATAVTQWNGIGIGQFSGGPTIRYHDDIYVLNTATGINTTFLGPVRIGLLVPVGAGYYAQWSPNGATNFGSVSDMPVPDDDGTFTASATAGQIDSFQMSVLPEASGSVFAIQHVLRARQDTGAARTIAPLQRTSTTDYPGTSVALSSSYQYFLEPHDTDPSTSLAWTLSGLTAAQFGYKEVS